MKNKIPLKNIRFGKTDAFNELKEYGTEWFKKAFFNYEKYNIDDFIEGRKYYICGDKGSGKTSFLRYLQCELQEDMNNLIIPIRFKSEIDELDRRSIIIAANNVEEISAEGINDFKSNDSAVLVWCVYIINKFFEIYQEKGEFAFFHDNQEFSEIQKLLKIVYPRKENTILPKIKHGQLTIETKALKLLDAKLCLDLDVDKSAKKANVNFIKIGKSIINKFAKLEYDRNRAYIIFDELELSVHSKKDNKRDIKLVRDLILAIDKLNEICKENGFDIHLIASVRNEVIRSVYTTGFEINKCIEDYGTVITWNQRTGSFSNNSLLNILENKIIASEIEYGITNHGDIWNKYFEPTINNTDVRKYILEYTWMHPRDIVRLMNNVQENCSSTDELFTQEAFDKALKAYSKASWNEMSEELILKYNSEDIKTIKAVFNNIKVPFNLKILNERIDQLSHIDSNVDKLLKKHQLIDILKDLFELGIIGNSGQRMIFKFLGDDELALIEDMIIHKPLRNFFAVKSRNT